MQAIKFELCGVHPATTTFFICVEIFILISVNVAMETNMFMVTSYMILLLLHHVHILGLFEAIVLTSTCELVHLAC